MADYKGLTVRISADASKAYRAIQEVGREGRKTASHLARVERALKFDPGNSQLITQKQILLREAIQKTTAELKEYNSVLAQQKQHGGVVGDDGKVHKLNADALRELSTKAAMAESALQRYKNKLIETNRESVTAGKHLKELGGHLETAGNRIGSASDKLTRVGDSMTRNVSVPIGIGAAACVKAAADFDDSFTGVRKTVNMTEEQFKSLKNRVLEFSETRAVDPNTINHIIEMGGQLGIVSDNTENAEETLMKFADVVSGLAMSTNLGFDEAATQIAQFANITGMSMNDVDRFGSALAELGNNSATFESNIMDMSMRIAASGHQIGAAQTDILGLAAAVSSLGIEAEAGGTAVSKTLTEIDRDVATNGKNLSQWARLAGMSVEEFTYAWKYDAVGAFDAVIHGMHDMSSNGENLNVLLNDMGINEVRQSNTLKAMASNADLVTNSLQRSNKAWGDNTALMTEVGRANAKDTAKFQILKNRAYSAAVSIGSPLCSALTDALKASEPLIKSIGDTAKAFSELDTDSQRMIIKLVGFTAAAFPAIGVIGRFGKALSVPVVGIGKLMKFMGDYQEKQMATARATDQLIGITNQSAKASTQAASSVSKLSNGAARSASGIARLKTGAQGAANAMKGFAGSAARASSAVLGINPYLAGAALGIGALAIAVKGLNEHIYGARIDEATKAMKAYCDSGTSFSDKVAAMQPTMIDWNSVVTSHGHTMQELDGIVATAQNNITQTLKRAYAEQNGLSSEQAAYISEQTEIIKGAYDERAQTIMRTMDANATATMATSQKLSAEQAAQEVININARKDEAIEAIKQGYQAELQAIQQKHEAAGSINSEGYRQEVAQARAHYQEQLDLINSQTSKAVEAITTQTQSISEQSSKGWADLAAQTKQDATRVNSELFSGVVNSLGGFSEMEARLRESFNQMNMDEAAGFLKMNATATKNGQELTDTQRKTATDILNAFENLPPEMEGVGREYLLELAQGMESEIPQLKNAASMSNQEIITAMRQNTGASEQAGKSHTEKFIEGFTKGSELFAPYLTPGLRKLQEVMNSNKEASTTAGQSHAGAFVGGFSALNGAVSAAGKTAANIASNSLNDAGSQASAGAAGSAQGSRFVSGISALVSSAASAGASVAGSGASGLSRTGNTYSYGSGAASSFVSGLWSGVSPAASAASSVGSQAQNINRYGGEAYTWGSHMGSGFAQGLSSMVGYVGSAATSIASKARAILHFTVPDEGPLADADEYGPDFVKLIAGGMLDNIGVITQASNTIANALRPDLSFNPSITGAQVSQYMQPAISQISQATTNHFNIDTLIVREQADVERIAIELKRRMDRKARA